MSFVRFFFWRLFRRPRVGDVFVWEDRDPWSKQHLRVIATSGTWAKVRRMSNDGFAYEDAIPLRDLVAFYRLGDQS